MTPAQRRAYEAAWPRWGLEHADGMLDLDAVFGRAAPRVLEIGFGMGHSLVAMAEAAPGTDFIGIEVHKPGVGKLLHSMEERGVDNDRFSFRPEFSQASANDPENGRMDGFQQTVQGLWVAENPGGQCGSVDGSLFRDVRAETAHQNPADGRPVELFVDHAVRVDDRCSPFMKDR